MCSVNLPCRFKSLPSFAFNDFRVSGAFPSQDSGSQCIQFHHVWLLEQKTSDICTPRLQIMERDVDEICGEQVTFRE